MPRWSIATVCMGGLPEAKLAAAAKAGLSAVEMFEDEPTFCSGKLRKAPRLVADLGVEVVALPPFRDFEAMPEPTRRKSRGTALSRGRRLSACFNRRNAPNLNDVSHGFTARERTP